MDTRVVEVRTLSLRAGTRDAFLRLYVERAVPLERQLGVDVVRFGPSAHDETSVFAVRAFDSLEHRLAQEAAYYGSEEWKKGPREALLAMVDRYADAVFELPAAAVEAMRMPLPLVWKDLWEQGDALVGLLGGTKG